MNLSTLDATTYKDLLVSWLKQYEGQETKTEINSVLPQSSLVNFNKLNSLMSNIIASESTGGYTKSETETLIDAYYYRCWN